MNQGLTVSFEVLFVLIALGIILTYIIEMFISPTTSTPAKIIGEIIPLMKINQSDIFADLGSGAGDFVLEVGTQYPKNKVIGYEISPILAMITNFRRLYYRIFRKKKSSIEVLVENFLLSDLRQYSVLYCHIPQKVADLLEEVIAPALKAGTRVYLYDCKFDTLKPHQIHTLSNNKHLFEY